MEEKTIKGVVVHDSHGNVVDEATIYPQGTEELVNQHNADQKAHTDLREAITGLRTKVEDRVTDVVVVGRDGSETSMSDFDEQGNKVVKLPQDSMGKVDGVKVNGEELEVDSQGKVNILIPTTVAQLTDASNYATKEYTDARTIGNVTATVEVGGEVKQATVTKDGADVHIDFPDLKGDKGDPLTWDDLTEQQKASLKGDPGDNCIPLEGESPLAQVISQATDKAITPKGVADAIAADKDEVEANIKGFLNYLVIAVSSDKIVASESGSDMCFYLPVKAGEYLHITASNASASKFRFGFSAETPDVDVALQGVKRLNDTTIDETAVAPINGYLVIYRLRDSHVDMMVAVKQGAKKSEVSYLAPTKALFKVLELVKSERSALSPTEVYENSLTKFGTKVAMAGGDESGYRVNEYAVEEEAIYDITGRLSGSVSRIYAGYAFLDANGNVLKYGEPDTGSAKIFDTWAISPRGATKLYVSGNVNSNPAVLYEITRCRKTIYPKMSYDYLSNDNATKGFFCVEMKNNRSVATMRFIKVNGGFSVTLPEARILKLVEYDDNFQYVRHTVYGEIQANVETPLGIGSNTSYVKIQLTSTITDENINIVRMKLKGDFPDNWDTFNISQFGCNLSDFILGRQLVIARVHVTDPICCEDDTSEVQDTGEYFADCGLMSVAKWEKYGSYIWDFGRIFLPPNYDNLGEPTRLIIYCHGAAVNYNTTTVTTEEINDLDPTYWLAEGYAVLDVEGNPFDNENEHQYSPQSMDCYVAAYKWAIEHYNLKRDGVFLGGRSMGGSTCINLFTPQCPIPVIAACPNVPSSQARGLSTRDRKDFWAKCCGLNVPDGHVWGDEVYTSEDKAVLLANFDKVLKNTPIFRMVVDLPVDQEESQGEEESQDEEQEKITFKEKFIDCYYSGAEGREKLWSSFHAIAKCPVKFFACYEDKTAPPERGAQVYYNMLKNCGQIVELRLFHDSRYIGTTNAAAHHYDTEDPAQRHDVVASDGTTVKDVPTVYVEMLRFWRRFEQE